MEVKIMVTGIIILTPFGVLCQANRAPRKLPRKKVTIIETNSNPNSAYDVELGFQNDKLWLFQIRPFVENKNALSNGYLDSIAPKTNPDEYIEMDSKL